LLVFAVLLALPVAAVPALVRGVVSPDNRLVRAAIAGLVLFAALFAVGAVLLATDGLLRWIGALAQRIRNRLRRRRAPLTDLPERLLAERDLIMRVLGRRWWEALL